MKKHHLILGSCIYLVLFTTLAFLHLHAAEEVIRGSDALDYSMGGKHIAKMQFYSLDGETAFLEREPGMSMFVGVVYFLFGIENYLPVFLIQGVLFFVSVLFLVRTLSRFCDERCVTICLYLLLLMPSFFHAEISLLREGLTLSLCILFATYLLRFTHNPSWQSAWIAALLLGMIILTYTPFVLLPFFLVAFVLILKLPYRYLLVLFCIPFLFVALWSGRNFAHTGDFRFTGDLRSSWMWHVRGEQAEHIRGLEPFKCLWAEYISRDWSGRSDYCSYNAVVNRRWPTRRPLGIEADIARAGQHKILQNLPYHLWFSVFEVLELHLPYVNGWGFSYNVLTSLMTLFVYVGCVPALPGVLKRREYAVFLLLILYATLAFSLTDATPRYHVPTFFAYIVLASQGYASLTSRRS